jgi:hypothetical protein
MAFDSAVYEKVVSLKGVLFVLLEKRVNQEGCCFDLI